MRSLREWTAPQAVSMFCQAAVQKGLIDAEDKDWAVNRVLDMLRLEAPEEAASLVPMLRLNEVLVHHAVEKGLAEDTLEARERFGARLFGAVTPSPMAVRQRFSQLVQEEGIQAACDWFYQMCRDCDYIRTERIAENILFNGMTPAGELEITINLSKPEKDPRDIAAARHQPQVGYPKCMLCRENPGYPGRPGYPARQNHRIIPMTLADEKWYFQYSPYLYYDEHCIVLSAEHLPMRMTRESFEKMMDFVDQVPHYFIGSNADLPIVGGSILAHDHFQGGRHVFPMEKAETWFEIAVDDPAVRASAMQWPMTCLKLQSTDRQRLVDRMLQVLVAWRHYSDEEMGILSHTYDDHNAITPVVRKRGDDYIAYLLLRNNRTSDEHPMGIYHPHQQLHHIKKENIGLIEAMGLFILPGRLKNALKTVADDLMGVKKLKADNPHKTWVEEIRGQYQPGLDKEQTEAFVRDQVAQVCYQVLVDTGVYPQSEQGKQGLLRFLQTLGMKELQEKEPEAEESPKYAPLKKWLTEQEGDTLTCTFEQIELILNSTLPESASIHSAWWANERDGGHVQARGWLDAGYEVESGIDAIEKREVTFVRPKKRKKK